MHRHQEPNLPQEVQLNSIELPDVDKNIRNAEEWLGKVVIVNHWAPWCPPCVEEIPILIEYQNAYQQKGVQVVGISHDLLETTRVFGDQIGINYPSLLAIANGGELLKAHGNTTSGALPFTVVFDRSGNLADTFLGKISAADLDKMTQPLL